MAVMRMHDRRLKCPDRPSQGPQRPWVEGGTPADLEDGDSVGVRASGELSASPAHETLLHSRSAGELAREQPRLVLAAPPFPTRVNLQDANDAQSFLGGAGAATRAIMLRNSVSVNGLWR